MDLSDFFTSKTIEGLDIDQWKDILESKDPLREANAISPGIIRVSDLSGQRKNKMVNCVCSYYTDNPQGKKMGGLSKSFSMKCFQVVERLGLGHAISCGSCLRCHRVCIDLCHQPDSPVHFIVGKKRRND